MTIPWDESPLSAGVTPRSQASDRFTFSSNILQEKTMVTRAFEIDSTLGTLSTKRITNMKSSR